MLHFSLVCSTLLMLAWLGTFLSGLFLLYVATLFIVMLPGLHRYQDLKRITGKRQHIVSLRRGLLEKHCGAAMSKMREMIKGKKVE